MTSTDSTASRPRALVTGASSGIGEAFAERFARDGYDLIIVARRRDLLNEIAGRLRPSGAAVEVLPADLANATDLRTVERRIRDGDALAMLVNNAGFGNYGPFLEADADVAEKQIALHLTALVRLTRAALPGMVADKSGVVINLSSMLAFSGTTVMDRSARPTRQARHTSTCSRASWRKSSRGLVSRSRPSAPASCAPSCTTNSAGVRQDCR